jgi:Na+/proline symporter
VGHRRLRKKQRKKLAGRVVGGWLVADRMKLTRGWGWLEYLGGGGWYYGKGEIEFWAAAVGIWATNFARQ